MEIDVKIMNYENEKSPEEVVREYKKKMEFRRNFFILIGTIFVIIWAFNSGSANNSNNSKAISEEADSSWIPSGFDSWKDPNIAWRWLETNEYECNGDACWGVMIISKKG